VWAALLDFEAYPHWNPFITTISGPPVVGGRITVRIEPEGARAMTFKPAVTVCDAAKRLQWHGRLLFPGIFDGLHTFEIEEIGDGSVRFHQSERFMGLAVPLFTALFPATLRGFVAMNEALKRLVEAQPDERETGWHTTEIHQCRFISEDDPR
jgi:hypothetical protein